MPRPSAPSGPESSGMESRLCGDDVVWRGVVWWCDGVMWCDGDVAWCDGGVVVMWRGVMVA